MNRPTTVLLTAALLLAPSLLALLSMAGCAAQPPAAEQTAIEPSAAQPSAAQPSAAQPPDPEPFSAGGLPAVPFPDAPVVYDTAEGQRIAVAVVTTGLTYPWGLAFLPDGGILVTERLGSLRRIRDGVLDPTPIAGVPEVSTGPVLSGLMDVAVHPRFGENRLVYLTYSKPWSTGDRGRPGQGASRGRDAGRCP